MQPSSAEVLERNMAELMHGLQPEFAEIHAFAPSFVGLMTETAVTVLVLEYVLRDKGLIAPGEIQDALRLARSMARAGGQLGSMTPAGRA